MKATLKLGLKHRFSYTVPESKTVPYTYPEAPDCECTLVEGRKCIFTVRAHDGLDLIGEGRHERFVVQWDKFNTRVADKAIKAGVA